MAVLGVSHLIYTVDDVGPMTDAYRSTGRWVPQMFADDVPIDPGKNGYLVNATNGHDLRLIRNEESAPAVEIISYGRCTEAWGHYYVAFGNSSSTELAATIADGSSTSRAIGQLAAEPRKFGLRTADFEKSERFWCGGLGFQSTAETTDSARVFRFPGILAGWRADLLLMPDTANGESRLGMLDDRGWNCVAFLVDDPREVGQRLVDAGGRDLTPEIRVSLPELKGDGRRILNLTFVRGPDGEIVELISYKSFLGSGEKS